MTCKHSSLFLLWDILNCQPQNELGAGRRGKGLNSVPHIMWWYLQFATKMSSEFKRWADFLVLDAWVIGDYKQKNTSTGTPERTQKIARIEVLALSMCWGMMISAICNKNELRIQEISRVSCESVWVATTDVWVQAKKHMYQDTVKNAKTSSNWGHSSQYVLSGDDICNL